MSLDDVHLLLETGAIAVGVIGSCISVGVFVGVTRTQTTNIEGKVKEVHGRIDKLETRLENAVTKSDFPAFFMREKHHSEHKE
jgi:hypothetical protein